MQIRSSMGPTISELSFNWGIFKIILHLALATMEKLWLKIKKTYLNHHQTCLAVNNLRQICPLGSILFEVGKASMKNFLQVV